MTATCGRQCDRTRSLPANSRKREYRNCRPETFGNLAALGVDFATQRLSQMYESPPNAGLSRLIGRSRRMSGLVGWRRSADRARLRAISLLSGNFTGKITISGLKATILKQETTAPQRLFSKFPKQTIREISPKNREFQADNREFSRQICKRPFLARLPVADVEKCPTLVRPPKPVSLAALFDHPVGAGEWHRQDCEIERQSSKFVQAPA